MSDIISCLCKLGFNRLEAQIYVALLEGGECSCTVRKQATENKR